MATSLRSWRRHGLSTVEMAVLLPVLLLLTFGAIEYSWMLMQQQQVTNVARSGARNAVLPGATNGSVTSVIASQAALAKLPASGYTITTSPGNVSAANPGDLVTVTLVMPYTAVVNVPMVPVPANLTATVTMAKEGP